MLFAPVGLPGLHLAGTKTCFRSYSPAFAVKAVTDIGAAVTFVFDNPSVVAVINVAVIAWAGHLSGKVIVKSSIAVIGYIALLVIAAIEVVVFTA